MTNSGMYSKELASMAQQLTPSGVCTKINKRQSE